MILQSDPGPSQTSSVAHSQCSSPRDGHLPAVLPISRHEHRVPRLYSNPVQMPPRLEFSPEDSFIFCQRPWLLQAAFIKPPRPPVKAHTVRFPDLPTLSVSRGEGSWG